jgi:hypothetical protein
MTAYLSHAARLQVVLLASCLSATAWAQSPATQPAYRPDEVTAYLSIDLAGIENSKILSAINPNAAKEIAEGRAQIREGLKLALGVDSGDLIVDSAQLMVFANDPKQIAGVVRGNWSAARVNEVLKAAQGKLDAEVLKLNYGSHQVLCLSGKTAAEIKNSLETGEKPHGSMKVAVSAKGEEAYVSVHENGPVLVATGMTAMGRMLDALDKDVAAGEAKFVPADAMSPATVGRKPLVSFWLRDIPDEKGGSGRDALPGPMRGMRAVSLAVWETSEAVTVAGGVSMPTQDEAFKLKMMADGAMMIAASAIEDPDAKQVLGAIRTGVDGSTMKVEWVWPMARMGELGKMAGEHHAKPRVKVETTP